MESSPTEEFRDTSARFAVVVDAVGDAEWDRASPVEGWAARDVVGHLVEWDVRDGGSWRYVAVRDGEEYWFRGCFHQVTDDRIVQTFTFEGMPDDVSLETLRFEDLGDGTTRLHAQSLVDGFEGRDAWLASGMEVGIDQGYSKLDRLVAEGAI